MYPMQTIASSAQTQNDIVSTSVVTPHIVDPLQYFDKIMDPATELRMDPLNDPEHEINRKLNLQYQNGDPKFKLIVEDDLYRIVELDSGDERQITDDDRRALLELILYSWELSSQHELYQAAVRWQFRLIQMGHEVRNLKFDRFAAEENARKNATPAAEASSATPPSPASPPAAPTQAVQQQNYNQSKTRITPSMRSFSTEKGVSVTTNYWDDLDNPTTYSRKFTQGNQDLLTKYIDVYVATLLQTDGNHIATRIREQGIEINYNNRISETPSASLFEFDLSGTGAIKLNIYPKYDSNLPQNGPYPVDYDLFGRNRAALMEAYEAAKARQSPD